MICKGDLLTEREQLLDEGRDITGIEDELNELLDLDLNCEENQVKAEAFMDKVLDLPMREGYEYIEPSDLSEVNEEASKNEKIELPKMSLNEEELFDKILGAWQGRASGCLLGKPVEGQLKWQMEKYLRSQGKYPLDYYFSENASEEVKKETGLYGFKECMAENITCMVEDDDTNYTVTGALIIKNYGKDFTPLNVGEFWLSNIPFIHVCTAERIAYKNIVNCYLPPTSAIVRNPYREWIGAQIRADFFGYVNPGNIEKAAEFAFRDASISHIKNGIYGEMWAAATIAAAFVTSDVKTIIKAGLSVIPAKSRLTAAIDHIIDIFDKGYSYDEAVNDVHARWNEKNLHHWCHTVSNAEIVAISLLYGEGDFEKAVTRSVMPGFDTDCNGATVGSIMGAIIGAKDMPQKWIAPMNDTLITGLHGYNKVSLTEMAKLTMELIKS